MSTGFKFKIFPRFFRAVGVKFYAREWRELEAMLTLKAGAELLDEPLIERALVLSEDHRFYCHGGVDVISMFRVVKKYIFSRKVEGASTITQQLVRTLTGQYERSLKRKCKEIALACILDNEISKKLQIQIYLNNAYFGWHMNGVHEAMMRLNITKPFSPISASKLIARLKYPEPKNLNELRAKRIAMREQHILKLIKT